jgi:hypothetical protein
MIAGNEGGYFEMHEQTGELYLVREIDLESLSTDVINLQIQVYIIFLIDSICNIMLI